MTEERLKETLELNGEEYEVHLPKEVIEAFNCIDYELSVCSNKLPKILDYITNLQARIDKANEILEEILVVSDWEHEGRFRPVKTLLAKMFTKQYVC